MKTIVLAAVIAFSTAAHAISVDFPSLWFPNEFIGKQQTDIQLISNNKQVKSYMKQNGLGQMESITKLGNRKYLVSSANCEMTVVVRDNAVLLIAGSVACN